MRPKNQHKAGEANAKTRKKRPIEYGIYSIIAKKEGVARQAVRMGVLFYKNERYTEEYKRILDQRIHSEHTNN